MVNTNDFLDSVVSGEEWVSESKTIFRAKKLYFYDTVIVDKHYDFVKTHRTVQLKEWALR
jgi:hypothetical protein